MIGDCISTAEGAALLVKGGATLASAFTIGTAGAGLTATGAGAVVGVPALVVSGALVIEGAAEMSIGGGICYVAKSNFNSDKTKCQNAESPNVDDIKIDDDKDILDKKAVEIEEKEDNLNSVWKLKPTERGKEVEKILASTEYKDWYNIGASQHGYFPVIDFQKGNNVISLKTIDPCLPSMRGSGATNKVIGYLDDLNRKITVDGKITNKILDVRIPKGTINQFDLEYLNKESKSKGIRLIIKEFK